MDTLELKKTLLFRAGITLTLLVGVSTALVIIFALMTEVMGTLLFALLIGGVGALTSLFRRFPKLQELELKFLTTSWWAMLMPILVGQIMAGLIYIVFFAGILTGDGGSGLFTSNLFPNFTRPEVNPDLVLDIKTVLSIRPGSVQDFGKLLVWCFLSGYSERFVPNILSSLERRVSDGEK